MIILFICAHPCLSHLTTTNMFNISIILSFWKYYRNRVMHYVTFNDWLFKFSIMPMRSIQDVACINSLFLSICWIVSYGVDGPVCLTIGVISDFWLLQIMLLWTFMYMFLFDHKFLFLWDKGLSAIAELYGKCIIGLISNCQTVFQNGYIRNPTSLYSHQHLVLLLFLFWLF